MTPLDTVLDALRARGCNPRQNGAGWTYHCPGHDDRHASGTLHEGADGRVLVKCHAGDGCSFEEIAAALDTPETAFFPPKPNGDEWKPVATYTYDDENGNPKFRVIRTAGKHFWQEHRADSGAWTKGRGDAQLLLYRLPAVLEAVRDGSDIITVEGEKDVEAIEYATLDVTATTSPMGAGKWRPEYAEALRGAARVIIVADRDAEGRKHAWQIAASLHGLVGDVIVAEAAVGNDVSDHLADGRTLEELVRVEDVDPGVRDDDPAGDQEQDHGGEPPPSELARLSPLRIIPVRQTLITPPPEPEPIASGLVNKGELVVLGAGRAWNKSLFVAQLGWKLAEGDGLFLRDFLIKRRCNVAIAQGEVTHHQSWIRWHHLSNGEDAPEGLDEIFDPWKIRTIRKRRRDPIEDCYEEWPEAVLDPRLEQAVANNNYDILFLDPWATYFSGAENSNDEVEAALDQLRNLSVRYGLAIWINHHFSQRGMSDKIDPEDAWRGASRLADWATTRITLLPHYTPKQAQKLGYSRYEARRYLDVRFLTRGAPIDDFSLYRRNDLWLARWDDPNTGEADDHVEELIDPVAEAVDARPATILNKQDVFDQLKAAKVKFNANNLAPAILLAAERGLIKAEKSGNTWRIRAIKKTP
jgi:5S rRNA maturation endonuclease (ribonuclease M5)